MPCQMGGQVPFNTTQIRNFLEEGIGLMVAENAQYIFSVGHFGAVLKLF